MKRVDFSETIAASDLKVRSSHLIEYMKVREYSLYKKKCKHNIKFDNLRTFKDEHFKLTGDLDWHVPYQ